MDSSPQEITIPYVFIYRYIRYIPVHHSLSYACDACSRALIFATEKMTKRISNFKFLVFLSFFLSQKSDSLVEKPSLHNHVLICADWVKFVAVSWRGIEILVIKTPNNDQGHHLWWPCGYFDLLHFLQLYCMISYTSYSNNSTILLIDIANDCGCWAL